MTIDYTDELQTQIDRFDRLYEAARPGDFPDVVASEWIHTGHQHFFDATLVEDPCIEVLASFGMDGSINEMLIHVMEDGRSIQRIHLEPGSGLWRAMEIWREEMMLSEEVDDESQ